MPTKVPPASRAQPLLIFFEPFGIAARGTSPKTICPRPKSDVKMRVTASPATSFFQALLQSPLVSGVAKSPVRVSSAPRIIASKYGHGSIRSASRSVPSMSASLGLVTLPALSCQFTRTRQTRGAGTSRN
jgi:hypothetical protein